MMHRFAAVALIALSVGCSPAEADQLPPPTPSAAAPVSSLLKASAATSPSAEAARLTATGTTHAVSEAALSARATGVLLKLNVGEGDRVKRGQILFQVDSRGAGLRVRQAKVGVSSAKVGLRQAKQDLERKEGLAKTGSVTDAALSASRLAFENAELDLKRAEVGLSDAQRDAGETLVRSPISGVIASKHANQGESVMANGAPVLLVQDISELEIRARLPESALGAVKPGTNATAHFRALNSSLPVKVKRISPSVDMRSRTIEVICALANPAELYKAGMLVELDFGAAGEQSKAPAPPGEHPTKSATGAEK